MRNPGVLKLALPFLLLIGFVSPTWGYGGGGHGGGGGGHAGGGWGGGHAGGWGGGWGGCGWGGYGRGWGGWGGYGIGLGWDPWWYGYDYGPYYDDFYDYDVSPYAYGDDPQPVYSSPYAPSPQAAPAVPPIRSDNSRYNLLAISDYHSELSAVLDKKLKDGDITQRQYDAAADHLNQLDQQAQRESDVNGGYLTGDQEGALIGQFQRAYYVISRNFVVD